VRRHGTDGRHYLLRYRFNGRQTFRKIGRHGSPFTPDTARAEARRLLGLVVSGTNPAQRQPDSVNFDGEVARYLTHKRSVRTLGTIERHLCKHCAPLRGLALGEIDSAALPSCLHRSKSNRVPSRATACAQRCQRSSLGSSAKDCSTLILSLEQAKPTRAPREIEC
jgi:hypothetical protein